MMTHIITDDWSSPWCCMIFIWPSYGISSLPLEKCLPLEGPHYLSTFWKVTLCCMYFRFSQQQRCYLDLKRKMNRFAFTITGKNAFQPWKRTHVQVRWSLNNPCTVWMKLVSNKFVLTSLQVQLGANYSSQWDIWVMMTRVKASHMRCLNISVQIVFPLKSKIGWWGKLIGVQRDQ